MKYRNDSDGESHCLECGKTLYGRTDKKFCNDHCRWAHYASKHTDTRIIERRTYRKLSGNYEILRKVLEEGRTCASLSELQVLGFDPDYMTTHRKDGKGHDECTCFDMIYCKSSSRIFRLRRMTIKNGAD